MNSIELIDHRYTNQIQTQQKLALIFNKAEKIINELNQYRQQQTESFYYDSLKQMQLVKVVDLTILPLHKPICQSVGSQTQWKIGRQKTQFEDENSAVFSTIQSQKKHSLSVRPTKFASAVVVKEICLNSHMGNMEKSERKTSRSKGISVLSQSPCKASSKQKRRQKQNWEEMCRKKTIDTMITN